MKKLYSIAVSLLCCFFAAVMFSCKDEQNEIQNPEEGVYVMLFSKDRHTQNYEDWLATRPSSYSFIYYCNRFDDHDNVCAKVTVRGDSSEVEFFEGTIDYENNTVSVKSEQPKYKIPQSGDNYYITSMDDLYEKAEKYYTEHESIIQNKDFFTIFFRALYDGKYPFINEVEFGLTEKDMREYDGFDSLFGGEFFVSVYDFKVLLE